MLFLQVFIKISIQLGGFSEQHQGSSRKTPREIFHVLELIHDFFQNLKFDDANI